MLLDFINNLHWFHGRKLIKSKLIKANDNNNNINNNSQRVEYKFTLRRASWLGSMVQLITSPQHVFQLAAISISMALGRHLDVLIESIQTLKHAYNWFRVRQYMNVVNCNWQSTQSSNYCQIEIRRRGEKLINNLTWSQWPVNLACSSGKVGCNLTRRFEQFLMILQILATKATIFTMLLHVESVNKGSASISGPAASTQLMDCLNQASPISSLFLFAFLIEAFAALHHYYDKYYSRYYKAYHDQPQH